MADIEYYTHEYDGSCVISTAFRKAINNGLSFGEWNPGNMLPSTDKMSLVIDDVCCDALFIPRMIDVTLYNCTIDQLFIEDMEVLTASCSFVCELRCVYSCFIEGLICQSVYSSQGFSNRVLKELQYNGVNTSNRLDPYFDVGSGGSIRLSSDFSDAIENNRHFGDWVPGSHLPKLPIYGLELVDAFYLNGVKTLDLSEWDTSKLNCLWGLFKGCSALNTVNLAGWDVSNVKSLEYAFTDCNSLTHLNLSGWDVRNAAYISEMFGKCPRLESLSLSGWKTESPINLFTLLFRYNSCLTSLDLTGWDFDNTVALIPLVMRFPNLIVKVDEGFYQNILSSIHSDAISSFVVA